MSTIKTGHMDVNGARLYYERRGAGPAVLFISGATGDAGHFAAVADLLADEFTVVTYDRRGNSRSPRPAGWTTTSIEEQADDAALLLRSLGLSPAAVFGNSGGAIIACCMLLRRAAAVRGAILHEPPLASVVPEAQAELEGLRAGIEQAMKNGGPAAAVDAFVGAQAGVPFDAIPADTRARMRGNGETLFGVELPQFLGYRPDEAALASVKVPVRVLLGEQTKPIFQGATSWLAARLRTNVGTFPGGHAPYFDRPEAMAAALRPLLRELKG